MCSTHWRASSAVSQWLECPGRHTLTGMPLLGPFGLPYIALRISRCQVVLEGSNLLLQSPALIFRRNIRLVYGRTLRFLTLGLQFVAIICVGIIGEFIWLLSHCGLVCFAVRVEQDSHNTVQCQLCFRISKEPQCVTSLLDVGEAPNKIARLNRCRDWRCRSLAYTTGWIWKCVRLSKKGFRDEFDVFEELISFTGRPPSG